MLDDLLGDVGESLEKEPREIMNSAFEQIKGGNKQDPKQQKSTQSPTDDKAQQQYIQDLYGSSEMTPEQQKIKEEQDKKLKRQAYQKIQQDVQEFRAKNQEEVNKQEIGEQEGLDTARDQEEKMEMWQEQEKKAKEKKKDQDKITLPGSAQSKSGEQGNVIG
jgi:hypothetical protein